MMLFLITRENTYSCMQERSVLLWLIIRQRKDYHISVLLERAASIIKMR